MNHNDQAHPTLPRRHFGATAQSRWLLRGEARGRLQTKTFATMGRISDPEQGRFSP